MFALSSCSGNKNPLTPCENNLNEREPIFRTAFWQGSDHELQDSSDAGGHVDVTNVVFGDDFDDLQGYIVKIGEYTADELSWDAAFSVAAWHEFDGSDYDVFFKIFYLWKNNFPPALPFLNMHKKAF